jgi:Trypsin-like peptidase domain/Pentapeptide repeats (8 copies)
MMSNHLRCSALIGVVVTAVCGAQALASDLTERARRSIVYISFDATDPATGGKRSVQGTGFVVSKSGYVLTAAHLFRDWQQQIDVEKQKTVIIGSLKDKPGFVRGESPLVLNIVDLGDPDIRDVALLKLPQPSSPNEGYEPALICMRDSSDTQPGENFEAFGFPLNQNFQGVDGKLGTQNARAGRWAAATPFTYGMSGGPVYGKHGSVIGLVEGGLDMAANWITPIQHARSQLLTAGYEDCPSPIPLLVRAQPFEAFATLFNSALEPVSWMNAQTIFDLNRELTSLIDPLDKKMWSTESGTWDRGKLSSTESVTYDLLSDKLNFLIRKTEPLLRRRPPEVALDLHWMSLWNIDLRDADLTGANLNDANLSDADMRNIRLNRATLNEAMFYRVDLQGADLTGISSYRDSKFTATAWWLASRVDQDLLAYLSEHFPFDPAAPYSRRATRDEFRGGVARLQSRRSKP